MRIQRNGNEAPLEFADLVGSERHASATHGEDRKARLLERAHEQIARRSTVTSTGRPTVAARRRKLDRLVF